MALPDLTTQDPATYKVNIDATAADHENRLITAELTKGWQLRIAEHDDKTFDVSTESIDPHGIFISPDGVNLYVAGWTVSLLHRYILSTPYDVSTAVWESSFDTLDATIVYAIFFSEDGMKMFVSSSFFIHESDLSVAWDITTVVSNGNSLTTGTATNSFTMSQDGLNVYYHDGGAPSTVRAQLGTAWDLSSVTGTTSIYYGTTLFNQAWGAAVSKDGRRIFGASGSDQLRSIACSTPFDEQTGTIDETVLWYLYDGLTSVTGMCFSWDGTKMYFIDDVLKEVHQYNTGFLVGK